MPKIESFSLSSILDHAKDEVDSFNESVKRVSKLFREDLSEELNEIVVKQNGVARQVAEVDHMAVKTLGATQARISRVQGDINELKGGELCSAHQYELLLLTYFS